MDFETQVINEDFFPNETLNALGEIYDRLYPAPDVPGRSMHVMDPIDNWHSTYSIDERGNRISGISRKLGGDDLPDYERLLSWIPKPIRNINIQPLFTFYRHLDEESVDLVDSVSLEIGPYMYVLMRYPNGGFKFRRRILEDRIARVESQLSGVKISRLPDADLFILADGTVSAVTDGEPVNSSDYEQIVDLMAYITDRYKPSNV